MTEVELFDDRLTGHSDDESFLDTAEEIAEELAQEHYESCYNHDVCSICADDTPLSKENGMWMGMASKFDTFTNDVEFLLSMRFGNDHTEWVESHLAGLYFEAFSAAAVEPEECEICLTDGHGCGHSRLGRDCPAD